MQGQIYSSEPLHRVVPVFFSAGNMRKASLSNHSFAVFGGGLGNGWSVFLMPGSVKQTENNKRVGTGTQTHIKKHNSSSFIDFVAMQIVLICGVFSDPILLFLISVAPHLKLTKTLILRRDNIKPTFLSLNLCSSPSPSASYWSTPAPSTMTSFIPAVKVITVFN